MSKVLTPEMLLERIQQKFNDPQVFIAEITRALPILCSIELFKQLEESLRQLFIRGAMLPKDNLFQEVVELFFVHTDMAEAVYCHIECFSDFSKTARRRLPPGMHNGGRTSKCQKPSEDPRPFDRRVAYLLSKAARR